MKLISLLALGVMGFLIPTSLGTIANAATETSEENVAKVTTYLALTRHGLYNGEKGTNNEELFIENCITFQEPAGTALPTAEVVTNDQANVTFAGWISYEGNGVPDKFTEVGNKDGKILYATWTYSGGELPEPPGPGTSEPDTSEPGTSEGSENDPMVNTTWYIVGEGSFLPNKDGATWSKDNGIAFVKNASSLDPNAKAEFKALGVHFEEGDVWKITDGKEWIKNGYENKPNSSIGKGDCVSSSDGYGGFNVKVVNSGTYDIYLKIFKDGGTSVWIETKSLDAAK